MNKKIIRLFCNGKKECTLSEFMDKVISGEITEFYICGEHYIIKKDENNKKNFI